MLQAINGTGYKGGYRCYGERHIVTDELLAERRGGCYSSSAASGRTKPVWEGPFYGEDILKHMWNGFGSRQAWLASQGLGGMFGGRGAGRNMR